MTRTAWLAGRWLAAGFCWLTAAYAFVASSAFAYQQFILPRVFAWVGAFSDAHAWLSTCWLGLLLALVWNDLRRGGRSRHAAAALLAACSAVVVWTVAWPVLPRLHDGPGSMVVGIVALVPIVWLAAIDHLRAGGLRVAEASGPGLERAEARLFVRLIGSAVLVTAIYAMLAAAALAGQFEPDLMGWGLAAGVLWSAVHHLTVASGAFLAAALVGRAAGGRFLVHYAALFALLTLVVALAFERYLVPAVALAGGLRHVAAAATGVSVVAAWAGPRVRHAAEGGAPFESARDLFVGRPAPDPAPRALIRLGVVAAAAVGLALAAWQLDWDYLLLRSGVLFVWFATFAAVSQSARVRWAPDAARIAALCLLPVAMEAALRAVDGPVHALQRYRVYNPSFRVADDLLGARPPISSFDRYLRAHTGFTDAAVAPVQVNLAHELAPAPADERPLIFFFVIDSLRPDYLSPYNRGVDFTPHLQRFAAESLVFANAFTRYGGTGLSMPAMWAGTALLHKQYVEPFYPMNALNQLLEANGYERWMSLDHITARIVPPGPSTIELDAGRAEMRFEFCRTLGEIERLLGDRQAGDPIFAHTRSLDLHVAAVRYGEVPAGESYPGFHAPYASRVHHIDACFGAFIETLKRRRLYDRSLIVFTSDHGELLGEDGRWGHSYEMVPEVIQIPLIVHLPASRRPAEVDTTAVALSTDITPTIYDALGYDLRAGDPLAGRSLLATGEPLALARKGSHVLSASYGAVYAVLQRNGSLLYITDGIHGGDRAFERSAAGIWRGRPVPEGLRTMGRFLVRQHVETIAARYSLEPLARQAAAR